MTYDKAWQPETVDFGMEHEVTLVNPDGTTVDLTCRLRPTITEFLLARVAEDEAAFVTAVDFEVDSLRSDGLPDTNAEEIREFWLRPNSGLWWKRVMAECEAKRRIIKWAAENAWNIDGEWGDGHTAQEIAAGCCTDYGNDALMKPLKALALPYADHPDYDETWRPDAPE